MALETLRDVSKIDDLKVHHVDVIEVGESYIAIDDRENSIAFKIQDGPIEEAGVNGCQLDSLIKTAKLMIEGLNKKYPCRENSLAVTKLDEALHWLEHRTKDRKNRGVEGTSNA